MNKRKLNGYHAARRLLCLVFALTLTVGLLTAETALGSSVSSYATPANNSVNYYSYNGTTRSSLGFLNVTMTYPVTGSATIEDELYYIILVNDVEYYAKASNLQLTADPLVTSTNATPFTTTTTSTEASSAGGAAGDTAMGTLRITQTSTNMRAAAHMTSGNVVTVLAKGTVLSFYATVVPPSGNHVWYYCYDPSSGSFGYVLDDCVSVMTLNEGSVIASAPSTSTANTSSSAPSLINSTAVGYVRITPKGKTNIRKSPQSAVKNVVAQADQDDVLPYYAVSVVDKTTWYYVYYAASDVFGYVQGNCAEVTAAASSSTGTATNATTAGELKGYIQFIAEGVNARKTAFTNAKVLGQFAKGTVVPYYGVVNSDGHTWYQVIKDGATGYVMGDFVMIVTGAGITPTATPAPGSSAATAGYGYLMTTTDKVYVRKKASSGANVYGQIASAGTVLSIAGPAVKNGSVTWYPVNYNDNVGYIHGGYAAVMNNDQAYAYQNGLPMPTATPTPTPVPVAVDYIQLTTDKVWIRTAPSTKAGTRGQASTGAVFHFTGTTKSGGVEWYKIEYVNETCYIMAKYCRVMTNVEYSSYQNQANAASVTPTPAPEDMSNIALTNTTKVIVRAEGSSKGKQLALLYKAGQKCTLLGSTVVANGYTWYNLTVNGITGWIRGDLLRILTKAEAANYNATGNTGSNTGGNSSGSSVNGVTLYKPELIDWYTGGIQSIFYKGCVAIMTDVKTGISLQVRRWSGGAHADVEPLTAADTAAFCKIYGVKTAQEISDKNLYQRRSVLVTIGNHSYAASIYGVPHNYPDGDTIPDNNFNGQFCIHFVNSKTHGSSSSPAHVDTDHQDAIMNAYKNAARLLGIN